MVKKCPITQQCSYSRSWAHEMAQKLASNTEIKVNFCSYCNGYHVNYTPTGIPDENITVKINRPEDWPQGMHFEDDPHAVASLSYGQLSLPDLGERRSLCGSSMCDMYKNPRIFDES